MMNLLGERIWINVLQAAVAWEAGKDLSIEDIEVEAPKAHEVRIEIYYTGVCHTGSHGSKSTIKLKKLRLCRCIYIIRKGPRRRLSHRLRS